VIVLAGLVVMAVVTVAEQMTVRIAAEEVSASTEYVLPRLSLQETPTAPEPFIVNVTMTVFPTGTAAVTGMTSVVPVVVLAALPIEVGTPIAA
jgi:hypothetical protein